jgi:hypothetical protein
MGKPDLKTRKIRRVGCVVTNKPRLRSLCHLGKMESPL